MKNSIFRRLFCSATITITRSPSPSPSPSPSGDPLTSSHRLRPRFFLPIPHRSLPDPTGHDLDVISVAHSHLIHSEWPKLAALSPSLTPYRTNHVLLRLAADPVLALEFHQWGRLHCPAAQSLDTHSIVLHILTKFRRFRSADSILREVLIPRCQNSIAALFDALLGSYRLCESSPAVFDALFKGLAHAKKFRMTTDAFRRMRELGFLPKVESCNAFMSSLLRMGRPDIVLSFYRELRRCRAPLNVYTLNMVMCALCKTGRMEKALEVFDKMEAVSGLRPTVSTFNTLISGYCKNGLTGAAVKLKNSMVGKGLEPDVITYNSLIHGFCREGMLHEANRVLSELKAARVTPNAVTYNTLINGYSQINNSEMGSRLYEEMVNSGVQVDIMTYNARIVGLCNEGKTKKASLVVKELVEKNLVPNATTFSALICGQCNRQNSERALQIYKAMRRSGHLPNCDTFKLLISTFCKNNDYEGAMEVLRDMLEKRMIPDAALLTELYQGLSTCGKLNLFNKLRLEVDGAGLIPG